MTPASLFLVPLNEDIPDPEDVTAGGVGAVVLVLLALAVVVLIFSFRKQLRKVRFEQPEEGKPAGEHDEANGDEQAGNGSYKP